MYKCLAISTKLGQNLYDLRSWISSIMGLVGHKQSYLPSIRVGAFDLVYTLVSTCIYDANLKIFMFEPKGLSPLKFCMNHHLVDVYKFCTQE